jgi:hypothetical protein
MNFVPRLLKAMADSSPAFSPKLACCICLFALRDEVARDAVTVIEGYAVCYNHMGYVAQGNRWHAILKEARL